MKIRVLLIYSLLAFSFLAKAASPLTLDAFLKDVRDHNLSLKIEATKIEISDAKSIGVTIPPPMVSFTNMEMKDGASAKGFEISQSIPFPTKLAANRSARQYEALAQQEAEFVQQNEILAQAKLAYFSLWSSQEKLETLREKKSVIDRHIRLATSAVRSDSFLKLHLLEAESDRDFVENEIEALQAVVVQKQLQLGQLIDADLRTFAPVLSEPPLSPMPEKLSLSSPPQVELLRLNFESLQSREAEAKSSWLPDFELRYKEMGASAMFPSYKEYMIGISLPFAFFWEPNSTSRAAKAQATSARYEYKREKQKIESEVISRLKKAESLKKQLSILKEKILPRAERRMKIAHNLAPRDMETLQNHRETLEAFPELKMQALELREQYEEAIAELERYAAKRIEP